MYAYTLSNEIPYSNLVNTFNVYFIVYVHSMIVCTTNKVMHHFIVDKKELPLISRVAVA